MILSTIKFKPLPAGVLATCSRFASSRTYDVPPTGISPPLESTDRPIPIITSRQLDKSVYCSPARSPRQAWLESLRPINNPHGSELLSPIGMVDLHPDVFSVFPRLDLVHKNLHWQAHYRMVDWRCITTRAELTYRSNRKPWPQKGTGRARHGNRRTHIWVGGGQCKGPRGPESYFSILPRSVRLAGLLTMLTVKHAQDDLHIVEDLRLTQALEEEARTVFSDAIQLASDPLGPDNDPLSAANRLRTYYLTKAMNAAASYLRQLVDQRRWGPSVLFITDELTDPVISTSADAAVTPFTSEILSDPSRGFAIHLACGAYANHVEAELSPEASAYETQSVAPRVTHPGRGLTLMPLHGLNVWSMVTHDTLVLSLSSLEKLEQRLLKAQRTVVYDQSLDAPALKPLPGDWLAAMDDEEFVRDGEPAYQGRRHFSEPIGSAFWERVKLS